MTAPLTPTHRDLQRGGRFAVFDWQTVTIGPGADDLSRIVSMGLTRADRAAHERGLIERYYGGLSANSVTNYSLEQCRHGFRPGLTASLTMNVFVF